MILNIWTSMYNQLLQIAKAVKEKEEFDIDPINPNHPIDTADKDISHLRPEFAKIINTLFERAREDLGLTLYIRETFRSRWRQHYLNQLWNDGEGGYAPDIYTDDGKLDMSDVNYAHGQGLAADIGIIGHESNEAPLHEELHKLFYSINHKIASKEMIEGDENHYEASQEYREKKARDLTKSPYYGRYKRELGHPNAGDLDDPDSILPKEEVIKALIHFNLEIGNMINS